MSGIDVTDRVEFGPVDGESLRITRCVCGATFPAWTYHINIYDEVEWMEPCPKCHRRLYFTTNVRVYEYRDDNASDKGAGQ